MKTAIKYIHSANPFYIHFKKHFCFKCGAKMELRYACKVINSKSPEAKNYDFSLGDTFLAGDVEFRTGYFYCTKCKKEISIQEMIKNEKNRKKDS